MSNNEPEDESDDSQQESEQQPADSDQPTEEPEAQVTDQSDQPKEQAEEEPTGSDEPTEQSKEQLAESDQSTEQPVQVAEAGGEQTAEGDGGATGASGNVASDTVAAAGGTGITKVGTRNLKVVAEFTEEDQKFIGEILIHVFESDNGQQGRLLFPTGGQFWQQTVQREMLSPRQYSV